MFNSFFLCVLSALAAAIAQSNDLPRAAPNANHIFNAIHSSMRQFGSSLNHNGMSVFFATVPQGTRLYHGTDSPFRVNGTEWLAFDPEFALKFTRAIERSPGNKRRKRVSQTCMDVHEEETKPHGYLHTYLTKRQLRLLYLDGQSGTPSVKGTLDLQDYIILTGPPDKSTHQEYDRAYESCHLAQSEWSGRIDGILRMETGFEIILCSFKDTLGVESITQVIDQRTVRDVNEQSDLYRAAVARFDGIGGDRVWLDYEDFVTIFAVPDVLSFNDDGRPRVKTSSHSIPVVRSAIKDMALRDHDLDVVDWQAVTDMVVSRYADRIEYLASGGGPDTTTFQSEVSRALKPFIDYSLRNSSDEVVRCSHQFIPPGSDRSLLPRRAILNVTSKLCSTLVTTLSPDVDSSTGIEQIKRLKEWLGWTHWKKCRGCGNREVCFLPVFPWGTSEDLESPTCRSNVNWTPDGYWND